MKITVGIPAHNEEENIGKILEILLNQKVENFDELEIVVVVSGSTDRTADIVREYQKKHDNIKLILQEKREGHASAVNEIIRNSTGDIIVFGCADTVPQKDVISKLVRHFKDKEIGAVVGKAIPVNDPNTLWGFIGQTFFKWNYQDDILMVDFEAFSAVRKDLIDYLPLDANPTERYVDLMVRKKGYKVIHEPEAIIYSKFPDNLRDFIIQRKRNLVHHIHFERATGIKPPHTSIRRVLPLILKSVSLNPKKLFALFIMITFSLYCYIHAWIDFKRGKTYLTWEIAKSTKKIK